ncbi:MFS general substrate transporter [Ceraceosorus guamensis]|uniref:MFS general substrate transporter n=1 Tax=Ceraceosorus guamensis TaxID=1522189 RepID=A0A316VV86_9BASI|nr:MFS general substrate transporter [Ceraceosorus guamensis]PWN41390.1 MFS general substrate transporter [Ceraceosorus guamensis]
MLGNLSPPAPAVLRDSRAASTHEAPPKKLSDLSDVKLVGYEDPRNWSSPRKWSTAAIISFMGFISPLGSSIVVPGSPFVDREFNLPSRTVALLPVSMFVLGLGMGPFLLAPASELKGRQPVYVLSSLVFVAFNVATAVAPNMTALIILRFLAGAAGSAGPSLGAGSIGDMFAPNERGRAQSLYGLGPLLGPVCGTVAGGWIVQDIRSWRWLLWTLTILSGAVLFIIAALLRETYAPVLLERKKRRAAKERLDQLPAAVANGLDPTEAAMEEDLLRRAATSGAPRGMSLVRRVLFEVTPGVAARTKTKVAFTRPFRLLFTNPICAVFSIYMGFIYGIIFLFLTQHPLLYQHREPDEEAPRPDQLPTYDWKPGPAGLTYIGLGLGFLTAALINVLLQDSIYRRLVASNGKLGWFLFDLPEVIEARMADSKHIGIAQREHDMEASAMPPVAAPVSAEKVAPTPHSSEAPVAEKHAAGNKADARVTTPALPMPVRKGRPEYRLPLCLLGMIILPMGLVIFGWAADQRVHWVAPLVGSYLVGMGSILPFQVILVYLVDAFIPFSASATACAVLVRSILAAVFPLFAQQMFVAWGFGGGSTFLAGISLLAVPVPIVLYRYGEQLRERFKFRQ